MADLNPNSWVDEYGAYLFRYAYSRLRDANAAEEAVQETFLAGVRYAEQFAGRGSERGWLMGILKRKIVDYVRSRNKHDKVSPYEDEMDPSSQMFDAMGKLETRRHKLVAITGAGDGIVGITNGRSGLPENFARRARRMFLC